MVEPSVLWTGERLVGIGRHHSKSAGPEFAAGRSFTGISPSDDGGQSFVAEKTPMVVGQTGAPYMTQVGGVLYSVVTDRSARTDDGRCAWTFTLWRNERGDAQSWEKIDDLLCVYDEKGETNYDFGYPWAWRSQGTRSGSTTTSAPPETFEHLLVSLATCVRTRAGEGDTGES